MRYYIDTEFIERGHRYPIELISIGVVAEDGREYYAVASDGWDESHASEWVRTNVLPNLGELDANWRTPRTAIAQNIIDFVGTDKPEWWSYYGDYDWVVFCQLFGLMIDLPKGWPMFCRDLIQLCKDLGNPELPKQLVDRHNAIEDARHFRVMHDFLLALQRK
jgi:hypothetical protein